MLEKHLHAGSLIYADNMDMSDTEDYRDYIEGSYFYSNQTILNGKAVLTKLV